MTRRRSHAPGRVSPDRRRSLLFLVLVALVVASCGITPDPRSSGRATATPGSTAAPGTGSAAPIDTPAGSGEAPASGGPSLPSTEPTTVPSATASDAVPTADASASAAVDPATACAGNAENRDFYAAVAQAVDWAVYCPVLGPGWFVETGQYRLAGGGWMEIAYKGPSGAHLALREGAACTSTDCQPKGDDLGEAAYGDMNGTLLQLSGDDLAVVVDPGATPSWSIVGSGLSQAAFEKIAADLARVGN